MRLNTTKHIGFQSSWLLIIGFTLSLISVKWVLINYGLPYSIHVDETTIFKDPFKIVMEYSHGDFSRSTNLVNWLFIAYAGVVYLVGSFFNTWTGIEEYKTFIISGSGNVLLMGRMLSLLVSVAGSLILLKLAFKITNRLPMRIFFTLFILFNPIEWNATNWIKFDPYSYLLYAIILLLAHNYFVEQNKAQRWWMYMSVFVGVSLRIEIVAYLIGFFIYDFFYFDKPLLIKSAIRYYLRTFSAGVLLYSIITLLPLTFIFNFFHPNNVINDLTVSPTFEEAIVTKIPDGERLIQSFIGSKEYIFILFSLMGPVVLVLFFLNLKNKESRFIYWPFLITVAVLFLFPVKETHYLLNVSVLLITASLYYFSHVTSQRKIMIFSGLSLVWTVSYCISFLSLINEGDVRIKARQYILERTDPKDVLLIEGIFTNIEDTPDRVMLRSEAAKTIGSTGLSSAYRAKAIRPQDSRHLVEVSSYEPFKNTVYSGLFTIAYDTAEVRRLQPQYFVYVARSIDDLKLRDHVSYSSFSHFFDFIEDETLLENSFLYSSYDWRIRYSNFYYFHPVFIYRFKQGS